MPFRTILYTAWPGLLTAVRGRLCWGLLVAAVGLPLADQSARGGPFSDLFGDDHPVGSPQWWENNEDKAQFEPGKGYTVEGVEGYFDQDGRPIDKAVEHVGPTREGDGLLPGLDPDLAYQRVKNVVGQGADRSAAEELFSEAEEHFAEGKYFRAAWHYQDAAGRWPQSPLEEDSLFMVGESRFFDNNYAAARSAYDKAVDKYPNTRHLNTIVDRLWAIAQYWEKRYFAGPKIPLSPNPLDDTRPAFDTIGHAIKTYDSIRLNDPTGPRADDAIMATAGIYFRRKRYEDADYHYTLLRKEYPRSDLQYQAHLLGLQAKLRKYQGPDYDAAPLDEAKQLAKRLRSQFTHHLSAEEKERLRLVNSDLNRKVAERDITRGEYYDEKKYYLAAREYYQQVVEQYPDSELAERAQDRLAKIVDEPDVPKEPLAWFVELFPQSREQTRVARIPELQDGNSFVARKPNESGEADTGTNPADGTTTR